LILRLPLLRLAALRLPLLRRLATLRLPLLRRLPLLWLALRLPLLRRLALLWLALRLPLLRLTALRLPLLWLWCPTFARRWIIDRINARERANRRIWRCFHGRCPDSDWQECEEHQDEHGCGWLKGSITMARHGAEGMPSK
jgi:hypothetical protein